MVLTLAAASIWLSVVPLTPLADAVQEQVSRSVSLTAIEQNSIGVGYMNQYLYNEASVSFQKAVSADPGFTLARINLGIALLYKQDYDGALLAFQDALTRGGDSPYAHYGLGLLYKNKGESEKAAEHFLQVTKLDPRDPASFYNLGVLKARLRQNEAAEAALRRSLELDPANTSAMYNLGSLLFKTGRAEEGGRMLERFRALQQKGDGSSGIGTQYGEMGEYALARDYRASFRPAALAPRPKDALAPFADRSAEAGLISLEPAEGDKLLPTPKTTFSAGEWTAEFLNTRLLPLVGGGVSLADLDNDGDVDAIATRFHLALRTWQSVVLRNEGKGRFTDVTARSGIQNSGSHISAALGDYDNDALPDVYLAGAGGNRLFRNLGGGRFEDVTSAARVADGRLSISATFVDYDHDGDVDLYVCHYADVSRPPEGAQVTFPGSFPSESNRMYRNDGNGTFTDFTSELGLAGGKYRSVGMVPSDLDNDRDIDLVVLHEDRPPQVFTNDRNDHFTEIGGKVLPGVASAFRSVTVADFNRDGAMDLLLSMLRPERDSLFLNKGNGSFQPDTRSADLLKEPALATRSGSGVLDYDSDGDLDLYVLGGDGGNLWENAGDGQLVFAGRLPASAPGRGAAAADLDGDGRVDVLYINRTFSPRFLRNENKSSRNWIGVQLEGLRSNKMGLGAKVEVRAGERYQKFEVQGHNGCLSQDSPVVWLGLETASKADTVTVRWPSGILQSEINVAAGRVVRVKELDRKGTSCPLLYTWNGKEFEFVTDFLGGSAFGYLVAPGKYSIPDTDEYVRIEGRQLAPRAGKYLLNLNNQLEEVILFDQAQLLVVDHPAGTEIYPNERLMPGPPFPEFKIHTASNARPPLAAVDQTGNDVLPQLSYRDRIYPTSFRSLPYKGYAERHAITLDLGELKGAKKILLLLDAWIDYADSSSNLAASQAGVALSPPSLEAQRADGKWETVITSMGFPAGLPKTMVVDLTDKLLPKQRRIRIVTNMKIYWDRIRIDTSGEADTGVTRLDPQAADLRFRGYPTYYSPDGKLPWIYDYNRIRPGELWGTHAGAYTRFGEVRELLLKRDDKFVITRHGDEIALAFDAARAPALPVGWVRDFLLYADGYGKDMDLNSLHSEAIGPLPFHRMSRFPYPDGEQYPGDEDHRSYRRAYNTRIFPVRSAKQLTIDD